ncbi:hypothetical protein CROQUDRAFT_166431 [Cronartium quercuum f. sp. fusiforme G11]|uniref:Uncharacterized protein n=1 Tax=Cronartium quercuum f. sp. fusiforme G11 TaxID=708437 RepID=A0A9P6NDA1_9BASI|nr:hypothetical protein CROQUDRAFT_166431 [Cronartium quercuum f. sp. fusiforme G11]
MPEPPSKLALEPFRIILRSTLQFQHAPRHVKPFLDPSTTPIILHVCTLITFCVHGLSPSWILRPSEIVWTTYLFTCYLMSYTYCG